MVPEGVVGSRCLGALGWLCQAPGLGSRNQEKPRFPAQPRSLPETRLTATKRRETGVVGLGFGKFGPARAFLAPALAGLRGGAGCYGESCESVLACGVRHTHDLGKAIVSTDRGRLTCCLGFPTSYVCARASCTHTTLHTTGRSIALLLQVLRPGGRYPS